ncbi:hypothetical protein [uncultured Streptomyces sp.]|uniref:hypothetical protein n=1 Tax=uncultured Streptomyces sp. TaxID=174707 RepID=UPI00260BDA11|nr:hypothetical protein [uncultured Streptomyces sp.]
MSQPVPPPNQPQPMDGNPYAAAQPGPAAPSSGNPFAGAPQTQPGGAPYAPHPGAQGGNPFADGQAPYGGAPFAPAPAARNNVGLGILAAFGAAVLAAILYGVIAGSIEREVGYAAVAVGFVIGFAASKVGGSNPGIIAASAVFALGSVYLGQLIAIAMIMADLTGAGFSEVFFDHFDSVTALWKENADFMGVVFLILGPVAAIGGAKRAS